MNTSDEIYNELESLCHRVDKLPIVGWHFVYHDTHMMYIPNPQTNMIRICIPHIVKAEDYDAKLLALVINQTNREVKFIKVVIMDNGSVCISYDHKRSAEDDLKAIVRHILKTLCYALSYFEKKIVEAENFNEIGYYPTDRDIKSIRNNNHFKVALDTN